MIMANPAICSIDSCGQPATRKSMCKTHYDRVRRKGDALWQRPAPLKVQPCRAAGCERFAYAKGLCQAHYAKMHRGQDELLIPDPMERMMEGLRRELHQMGIKPANLPRQVYDRRRSGHQ